MREREREREREHERVLCFRMENVAVEYQFILFILGLWKMYKSMLLD